MSALYGAIGGVIAALITVSLGNWFQRRRDQRLRSIREHKRVYAEIVRPYSEILGCADRNDEAGLWKAVGTTFVEAHRARERDFIFFASSEVLRRYANLVDSASAAERIYYSRNNVEAIRSAIEDFVRVARDDLQARRSRRVLQFFMRRKAWNEWKSIETIFRAGRRPGKKEDLAGLRRMTAQASHDAVERLRPQLDELRILRNDVKGISPASQDYVELRMRLSRLEDEIVFEAPVLRMVPPDVFGRQKVLPPVDLAQKIADVEIVGSPQSEEMKQFFQESDNDNNEPGS
jgi:hypothetical protein